MINEENSQIVISVDLMMRNEALVVLANLSLIKATRTEEPILHVHGWINDRIVITIVRLYPHMIRVVYIPNPLHDR